MQYIVFLILAPIAAIVCVGILFYISRSPRASSRAAVSLRWYLVIITGFLLTNTAELLVPTPGATLFLAQLDYLFIALTPAAWFAFVLAYTGRERWLTLSRFWPFCISPLITILLAWTNGLHGLIWQSYSFQPVGAFISMSVGAYGSWFWVHTLYSYSLFLVGAALVSVAFFRSHRLYRRQSAWALAGALTPLLANLVYIFRLVPGLRKDFSPVTFAMAGLAFAVSIFRYRLFDLMPVARAVLVEELRDGVIVLDQDERVVDLNPAARRMLGLPAEIKLGRQASELLPFWRDFVATHRQGEGAAPAEIILGAGESERVFELHVSPLSGRGRLITLRDVTTYKQAEMVLQQAQQVLEERIRERTAELTALNATLEQRIASRTRDLAALYAVSSVASEVHDLDSLLSESLSRTLAALQSDAGAIYLIEEEGEDAPSCPLRLAVHQAESPAALQHIQAQIETHRLADWVIENGEPVLISERQDGDAAPAAASPAQRAAVLIVPMRAEGKVLGVLGLSRLAEPLLNLEEVALLSTIADQVGVAVTGYRFRQVAQQALALAQRQQLAADLHDSITQSLYGLVAFGEAGQAQIERGDLPAVKKTIERISAETRQALKEMRLFLYELRPSVLEAEGLIGALHQRLAAVEGRSDVRARLLQDDRIHLPLAAEEALFRIAQEALNNTLRHSRAANVTVYLGREEDRVILEVIDDGCGFDLESVGEGRMGLANMRARAAAVGGEFAIRTLPGHGTRLKVTLPSAHPADEP